MELPRDLLGIGSGAEVRLKAADHVQDLGNITDYYIHGDSAPIGRFYYTFRVC